MNPADTAITHFDVAIVGGGPAGLSTAVALALRGVSSVIVEKKSWPIDKVCGEGLMPTGVAVLERLGVLDHLAKDMLRPFHGIRYIDASGIQAEGRFPHEPGLGIRRVGLSRALYDRALSLQKVSFWDNTTVRHLSTTDEYAELAVKRNGQEQALRARVVIGADGLHSRVRQWANLTAPAPTKQKRWGTRQHFQVKPWTDHVEVYWRAGFEAYVTPSSENRLQIAFLWDRDQFHPRAGKSDIIQAFLGHFPELAKKLQGAIPEARPRGIGPLAHAATAAHTDRILLMGDALGYVDGITGEGVAVALQQAETIAEHLPQLLQRDTLHTEGLSELGHALREVYKEGFCMIEPALLLTRHPTLRQMAIRGLSRAPGLFTHILASNMCLVSPFLPPLAELPKFLFGVASPKTESHCLPVWPTQKRSKQSVHASGASGPA